MTDIVARLRALVILDEVGSNNPLGREAADEIERLCRICEVLGQKELEAAVEIERLRGNLLAKEDTIARLKERL